MHVDIESSVRAVIRSFGAVTAAAIIAAPGLAVADGTQPDPAAAAAAQTAPAPAEARPAAPAKAKNDDPTVTYTPSAGVWRDRLRDARKDVLTATAALDDLNAHYARVLYETPDDTERITTLAKKRQSAMQRVNEARAAIPPLVEQARAYGVSERILELYEQATLE